MLLLLSKEVDPTVCPTLMEGVNYLKDLRSGAAKVSVQDEFRQGGWSALLRPVFDTFNACTYVRTYVQSTMYVQIQLYANGQYAFSEVDVL